MQNYENTRLSDSFINLTDQTIYVYDKNSGDIYTFPPKPHELPALPSFPEDEPVVHYILDAELIPVIAAFRPLDDIVRIHSEFRGRNHIKVTYLAWGKDEKIDVCLFKGARQVNFPHK